MLKEIRSYVDIEKITEEWGILPFFRNNITGFSISENTPEELWFQEDVDGPWEWKGPIVGRRHCVYGKFFNGKAGYVSLDIFPEFLNYRRRTSAKLTENERLILHAIKDYETLNTKELKTMLGFVVPPNQRVKRSNTVSELAERQIMRPEPKRRGFDSAISHLQMSTEIVVEDFDYPYTRQGQRYGWGIARYSTPEALYDAQQILACRRHTAAQSLKNLLERISTATPFATETQLLKLIK